MVGGGIKKDDGLPAISSSNIFSALESRRRKSGKKKPDKDRSNSSARNQPLQAPQVWKPAPVTVSSWADCEDDDDYFATPSLPPPMWSSNQPSEEPTEAVDVPLEELSQGEGSEGDEEIEEEPEEENEEEPETEVIESAADAKSAPTAATVAREPDKQLSRKEQRRKELAELEAVLAELGLNQKEEDDAVKSTCDKKEEDACGDALGEMETIVSEPVVSGPAMHESKSSKRRKAKIEKSLKEGRNGEVPLDADNVPKDNVVADEGEDNSVPTDPKEVVKRLASMKKKKFSKDNDGAAKAAAAEAAARASKLAAAKKREKNHYNQQPVR